MPTATLTFSLPEEQEEYEDLMKAVDERNRYRSAISGVFKHVRDRAKYHELSEGELTAYEQVKEWFHEAVRDYDVELTW